MYHRCILCIASLFLFVSTAFPQSPTRGFPKPPPTMDDSRVPTKQAPAAATPRTDLAQAQREADDLARVAQTIPADVTKIREGMLPKDVIEKLKRTKRCQNGCGRS